MEIFFNFPPFLWGHGARARPEDLTWQPEYTTRDREIFGQGDPAPTGDDGKVDGIES